MTRARSPGQDRSMDLILNQVAIWRGCGASKLNIKVSPAGRRIRRAGKAVYEMTDKPCKRYAKDYTKNKITYCLMVFSDIDEEGFVEEQLDAIAKKITKEQALKASANATITGFEYLPNILKEEI